MRLSAKCFLQGDAGFLEADVLVERLVCRFCRVFVADVGVQRGDEHERIVEVEVHLFFVRRNARRAVGVERHDRFGKEAHRLQKIIRDNRHKYVEFEIALTRADTDGDIVSHHLHRNHRHRFALRRIDFSRHNGRARLHGRQIDFVYAAARPRRHDAQVGCNLSKARRKALEVRR